MSTESLHHQYILPTYAPPPLFLEKGKGTWVWDEAGNRYLDFTSGIAVNTLGHCHRNWVRAVARQAGSLVHTSNLFGHRQQSLLAERLVAQAGPGKVFFANSGAEANEALIKLARLHGCRKAGGQESRNYRIICATNAFHGRTYGGMSATPKANVRKGFGPLLDGFSFAPLNNLQAFREQVDEQTNAILVETIQGEGGIHSAEAGFLQGLRKLCDEFGLLLLIDEVQCGIGRSGAFFAFQHAGIQPDAIGMAKGLGGGFPLGAIWVAEPYADLFVPGSHGTTFGGSPLSCAAALATLDTIDQLGLIEKAKTRGTRLLKRLARLQSLFPALIRQVRGRGFMIGIELTVPAAPVVATLREKGMLVPLAGEYVFRLLPPLNVQPKEISHALDLLEQTFRNQPTAPQP